MVASYSLLHQRGSSVCCYLVVVGLCFKSVPCSNWKFGALQTPLTALITKGLGHLCCTLVPVLNAVGFFLSGPSSRASLGSRPRIPGAALSEKNVLTPGFSLPGFLVEEGENSADFTEARPASP